MSDDLEIVIYPNTKTYRGKIKAAFVDYYINYRGNLPIYVRFEMQYYITHPLSSSFRFSSNAVPIK